ncbi:MAG: carbohydrate binding domain-containing protein [Planctomycetota bacterium]
MVLVLAVTLIVGLIGLSGMYAVRLQHTDIQVREDAVQAQQFADSLLEVIHTRLGQDSFWRTNHTHDVWTSDEAIAVGGVFRYKLSDEGDGDLADDENDSARLTVRVAYGDAVRLASIEIGGGATLGPEMVTNGDMEAGTSGYGISVIFGDLDARTDNPHSGTTSLELDSRTSQLVAMKQDFADGAIKSGKTYRVSAWARLESSVVDVKLGLFNSRGLSIDYEEDRATGSLDWTYYQFDLTPSYSFEPTLTYVYGVTATGNQDMHFDELSVREVLSAAPPIVRGSYRRELDEP